MTIAAPCICGHDKKGHAHTGSEPCVQNADTANPPFNNPFDFLCGCDEFIPQVPTTRTTRFPTVCKTQGCHHSWEQHTGSNPSDVTDTACTATEQSEFDLGLRPNLYCTCKQFKSGVGG